MVFFPLSGRRQPILDGPGSTKEECGGSNSTEGPQGVLPQPEKDLERPSSTRLEARFPYYDLRAMTRSPSPFAWRPDFPGAPREAH